MSNFKTGLFRVCIVIIAVWAVLAALDHYLSLPTVYLDSASRECVEVHTRDGEAPCSSLPGTAKYHTVWVAPRAGTQQ